MLPKIPAASRLIAKIAPELGIKVVLEPEYEYVGEMTFPNGCRRVFRGDNLGINPGNSTAISVDKAYTSYFLKRFGFQVPDGKTFFSVELNKALEKDHRRFVEDAVSYAQQLGYPVFVKPNNLSEGVLVTKVFNDDELRETAKLIFQKTHVMILEKSCEGNDYRVVVCGSKLISAYQRLPLSVQGDGTSTIDELIWGSKKSLPTLGRPTEEIDPEDFRIDRSLQRKGYSRDTVLVKGEYLRLLDNANLSTGGTAVDLTDKIHPSFVEIAMKAGAAIGLRFCGVDIICEDATKPIDGQKWWIIELNSNPGLDNYASLGAEQKKRVESMYREILLYMKNSQN